MKEQDIFTQASFLYLDCQRLILELVHENPKRGNNETEKEVTEDFDYMIQMFLLFLAIMDSQITPIELKFVHLITQSGDILSKYSEEKNTTIGWNGVSVMAKKVQEYNDFCDELYAFISKKLDYLIMFLASTDAITKKDYLPLFEKNIKGICTLFSEIDKKESGMEKKFIDFLYERIFSKKFNELKEVYGVMNHIL